MYGLLLPLPSVKDELFSDRRLRTGQRSDYGNFVVGIRPGRGVVSLYTSVNCVQFSPMHINLPTVPSATDSFQLIQIAFYLLFVTIFCSFASGDDLPPLNPDPRVYYTMMEIVCSEGYYMQEYEIETDDGYILTLHRIPNGKRHPKIPPKRSHYLRIHENHHPDFEECVSASRKQRATGPPVLLVHGLLGSSDLWINQGPGYDLAYLLVDEGYDVWLINLRGNFYSRKHKTLKPSQAKFWDFRYGNLEKHIKQCFHENGVIDVPNTIDYILHSTNHSHLTYIGHSMGTTIFFVMASLRPEYNAKLRLVVAMAPVTQIRRGSFDPQTLTVLLTVMALMKECYRIGVYEFLPRTNLSTFLVRAACAYGSPLQDLCYDTAFSIFGYPSKLVSRKSLPMCLSHSASSVSVKTFLHYDQLLDKPNFTSYDHGPEENLRRYGQASPLEYDLSKITVPIALFYSSDDFISRIKDVAVLKSLLPNVVEEHEYTKYNHQDFVWAYSAREKIYGKIVRLLRRFTDESGGED